MIPRTLTPHILRALRFFPALALFGVRQAGKTTLVRSLPPLKDKSFLYLDLELESDIRRLETPELFLRQHADSCVIIDEAQRKPELFTLLRSLIDENRTAGRFILLGSASPILRQGLSESLAGRIAYFDISPLHRQELLSVQTEADIPLDQHWLRGGFAPSLLAPDDVFSDEWRRNFTRSYIERDLPEMLLTATGSARGGRITTSLALKLWRMLVHYQGSLLNTAQLASSLGISAPTIQRYIEILEDAALVRRLLPYYANTKKRLIKTPKIYIRDSGLLHALADIPSLHALQGHPLCGQSWEGYVIEQLCSVLTEQTESRFEPTFYRTQNGSECDMVVLRNGEPFISIEIKYSDAPKLSKGHALALEDLQTPHNLVIIPHGSPYPSRNNTIICGLDECLRDIFPALLTGSF